jgi:hypothetical protein
MIPTSAAYKTAIRASSRYIRGRISITWSDQYIDTTITTSANVENRISYRSQTYDGVEIVPYKWAHCDSMTALSIGMHPAPSSDTHQMGWWTDTRCGADKIFATAPELTMNFAVRAIFWLKVVGDSILNEFPEDFTIKLYNVSTLIHTETVTGNTLLKWEKDISSLNYTEVTKAVLNITKWSTANRVAKISEFYTSIKLQYEGDDLKSVRLLEEMDYTRGSLPIGNISANEIDLEMMNVDNKFFWGNTLSPVHTFLKPGRRIEVELGCVLPDTTIEYVKLGTFFSGDWQAQELGTVATTTARDRLDSLRKTIFSQSTLYTNYSLYDLAEVVLNDAKLTMKDLRWNIDTDLQSLIIPNAWFPKKSHRDTIRDIVEACMGYAYMDRDDVLQIGLPWNINLMSPSYEITSNDYFSRNQPSKTDEIANLVSLTIKPRLATAYTEIDLYKSGENDIGVEMQEFTVTFDKFFCTTPTAYLSGNKSTTTITSEVYTNIGGVIQVTATASDSFVLVVRGTPTKEIVYESKEDIVLAAGASQSLDCVFEDSDNKPAISCQAQIVNNTSPTTTITSETHYAWKSDVTVSSVAGDTFKLRVYGVPVIVQGEETVEASDSDSILENGTRKYEFPDNHLIQSRAIGLQIVTQLLSSYKDARKDTELDWRGDPSLELIDTPIVPVYVKGSITHRSYFYITKQEIDYDGTLRAKLDGRRYNQVFF